ncbi:MAG: DUF3179 domain-containing protein [Chloroflexi bacterium]|nr:DUF3179 domain-containing protein [Chloroflexota bacterium]
MVSKRLLSIVALLSGFLGALAPLILALQPRMGFKLLYRLPLWRNLLVASGLGMALLSYRRRPSRGGLVVLGVTILQTAMANILRTQNIFVSLTYPPHLSASEAGLGEQAPVLGLALGDIARAWPLELVAPHHLINDGVGERAILASYCPLCHSGMVYDRAVNSRILTFEVAGFGRRNMMMRDRETSTIWQQATGEAVAGPLQGAQLEFMNYEQATWAAWRNDYPQTLVAAEPDPTTRQGLIFLAPYQRMFELFGRIDVVFPGRSVNDARLPSRTEVAGIILAGEARAYPLESLHRRCLINDRLGGKPIAVTYEPGGGRVRAFTLPPGVTQLSMTPDGLTLYASGNMLRWDQRGRALAGTAQDLEPVAVEREWWMAWSEFHPDATIHYEPEQNRDGHRAN